MFARQAAKYVARKAGLERRHIAAARMYCERHALASFGGPKSRPGGRILAYHTVGQPEWGVNDVTPAQFRRHLELARDEGFRFVPASEIARNGGDPKDLAITFDDGMKSVLHAAAPVLEDLKAPYTVFVVSTWANGENPWVVDRAMSWRELAELREAGAIIGSHSATHPDFATLTPDQFADELTGSRRLIEAKMGFPPHEFAIPFGQSGNWPEGAAQAACAAGYSIVYAQAEETRPKHTVARTFVTRFDDDKIFRALLKGKFDRWEEWF